jgi:hypothetical protein
VQGIRLRDVTIAAPYNTNLKIDSSQHVEVDHIVSKDSADNCSTSIGYHCGQGIIVVGGGGTAYAATYSDDVQIWNSRIYNNGGNSSTQDYAYDHGIYMCSGGSAVGTSTESGCRSFVIANNLIYDQPDGYGIQLGDSARNGIVTNNTFDSATRGTDYSGCGIIIWSSGPWGSSNNLIVNNIFSNNAANAICASVNKNPVGNVVRNNLSYNNYQACNWCRATNYDAVYGSYIGFTVGTNLPDANPLYVNRTSGDFHLQASSPARGKADPAYTPPFDADGSPRSSSPALGAFG